MLLWRLSFDDFDSERVRRPFFVPSRSCVCVSVGCFERTLLPHQHAVAAHVCKVRARASARRRWVS